MRPSSASIFAISALAYQRAKAIAMPSSEFTMGMKSPDHFASMDITDGIPTGPPVDLTNEDPALPLQAHKNVNYCIRDPARSGVCVSPSAER
ncbi:unnamed protein product [Zymoseptoria tritici ST99CH_3D7]|uniref:Uncharacterized protein n=1 Tax=Zymoseptoria tritici (strain ST99CH_3D7) TaxID=1276538 RepID=A0A1X7RY64_ZYMT9|nr:unnamed protein product [Zymoseptoria tritici ST99CH_3D7]